eukprot:jgi/Tetstr1/442450/TSEL_003196.t1
MALSSAARIFSAVAGLLLLAAIPTTRAYPSYYSQGLGHDGCALPTRGYGAHKDPEQDSSIVFELLDLEGEPVVAYLPGETYDLRVSTGSSSLGFVLASDGAFDFADFECGGTRRTFVRLASSNTVQWTAPVLPPAGPIVFSANFATGAYRPYLQNTASFPQQL